MLYRMIGTGLAALCLTACSQPLERAEPVQWQTLSGEPTLVIAHRGASGDLPEHTLEAYSLAIEQGADIIEPDLVMTADGVLVARHDRYLSTTTDVADKPEFTDRRRIQGDRNDWWIEDFTLEELRMLRARQPRADRPQEYNGQFLIPTFEEVLDLAAEAGVPTEPEIKSPDHFVSIGLDPLPELVRILRQRGLDGADAMTSIQCFEPDFLARLNGEVDTPLLMLVFPMAELDPSVDPLMPTVSLQDMAAFADGVGPAKSLVMGADGSDTGFISAAHALGLSVHPWTFRDDQPVAPGIDAATELEWIFRLGADGVFTDFPATAVAVRSELTSN